MESIIKYSINHKIAVLLFSLGIAGVGIYSMFNIPIGAVPDVTNNQVQVITTSRNLAAEDVERFLTYPVELEMANLPGVKEIRSISKFGLSVVTVVFDDNLGTFLPRQLIAEKLQSIESSIPAGFGSPEMGPISTGLGEIYQYILDVVPEKEGKYSVTELRSIQDWIVKRQLSGIPGVVEVNTWGGFLKTYEVAVNPEQLRAMDITLHQVYQALNENNSIAGGGYIEKSSQAYFIRAEGLIKSLDEIADIVVDYKGNIPVYMKDVAKIGFGRATRFGAITGNGEGEKVLGQVMMLKGANSNKVISRVKERVASIQESLPDGVFINPFLERTELIQKTTWTIGENLVYGFLIVLLVVVFLLGNIRSGLVIASVIPLTLFFALSLMYFFGVDANLMSLGAIDFGIIIDGAVIIVEFIAFKIAQNGPSLFGLTPEDRQKSIDEITYKGAGKMMHSAIFGQIIIIIVFIPILTLSGIEGKMFKPMALTFCFALLGAMILCFTYVPVMASLFIRPGSDKMGFSAKFINGIKRIYKPILLSSLRFKYAILFAAVVLLGGTAIIFSRMGGEFIPTLDEGDFVIQPVLKTGLSLEETVKITTRIESILGRFSEVDQVVTRIGAAEVPTDPMSMEESDVIITLKDKSRWQVAASKDELAEVFKEALTDEIPGIEIEFTQPIEMRFNELITGVRADLAIKLFGEDLDILSRKAIEIEQAIRNVEGAADISVEKTAGLPQMKVKYDRERMAKYGVNIKDLNDIISIGFAGKTAGIILEGERQFDLVLRYEKEHRQSLDAIKQSIVDLPSGMKVPLSEFASITIDKGPAKISRDDTKRRVVVGVNVRGRDLESVVEEINGIITNEIDLPTGYHIEYGGQFQNLREASSRLLVAVPIALILIFVMLYFAFHSVKEALLIYTAIPMAAIGGVLALYFRDMPFSISAGVGFVALFGIAVLNGIVLLEHFNELKRSGMEIRKRVVEGTLDRIRPVLLTALAAAFGFLPMAISTSAGAEVQRPLATVVIGGLITATILTLIILPLLYCIFENGKLKNMKASPLIIGFVLFLSFNATINSQTVYTVDEILDKSLAQNLEISIYNKAVEEEIAMINGIRESSTTNFFYEFDRANRSIDNRTLHVIGGSHTFIPKSLNEARMSWQKSTVNIAKNQSLVGAHRLGLSIYETYEDIRYFTELGVQYRELVQIFSDLEMKTIRKYELGESPQIRLLESRQKAQEFRLIQKEIESQLELSYDLLKILMNESDEFNIEISDYRKMIIDTIAIERNPEILLQKSKIERNAADQIRLEKSSLPQFNISIFNGVGSFSNFELYPGFQLGIGLPLSKDVFKSREEAAKIRTEKEGLSLLYKRTVLNKRYDLLNRQLKHLNEQILFFEDVIAETLEEIVELSGKSLDGGETDYFEYLSALQNAVVMKIKLTDLIHQYNRTTISMKYITL